MATEKELTLEQAQAKIAEQATRITDLEGEVEEATETISTLQEQLANAEASQAISQAVVVTHTDEAGNKEQYKAVLPKFKHKGQSYVAADLKTNPALVKELVDGGKGVLVKLEKAAPAAKAKTAAKEEAKK